MPLNCGIVGLPNVGKSTIFNALNPDPGGSGANYPFCTIEPNTGLVTVPDARLWVLKDIAKTKQGVCRSGLRSSTSPAWSRAPARAEGKGNEFLSAIKNVDAVLHVVRCFEDPTSSTSMVRSIRCATSRSSTSQLLLKDEETAKGALDRSKKRSQLDKEAAARVPTLEKVVAAFKELKRSAPSTSATSRRRISPTCT